MVANGTVSDETAIGLAKTGVLFGHRKSKTHPRMRPFIGGMKNEVELLDPYEILKHLEQAMVFLKEKVRGGGLVLLVGTTPSARTTIEGFARECAFPYVTGRWLGGTLTNFKMITDRLRHYADLKAKRQQGELLKYTKKEQQGFNKEIAKLAKMFDGLVPLVRLPDVLFVVDIAAHMTAVREARKIGIPIVAILDTDDDPELVDHPIFANDRAKSSIDWVVNQLQAAVLTAKAERAAAVNQSPPAA